MAALHVAAAAVAATASEDAIVTLVTKPPYVKGAVALAESLRRWSHPALVALVTPEVDALRPTLAHFYELVDVEHLSCLGLQGTEVRDAVAEEYFRFRFASACTKLHIFNLTRFRAVLYLDADMIVLRSPAPILERARWLTEERPLAAGPEVIAPSLFNAGAMLVRPSAARFEAFLGALADSPSYDGADQGFLNHVFSDWYEWDAVYRLPQAYNVAQHVGMADAHSLAHIETDGVAIFHFVGGDKPWMSDTMCGETSKVDDDCLTRPVLPPRRVYHDAWHALHAQGMARVAGGAARGAPELRVAAYSARLSVVRSLLRDGADVDAEDWTPLLVASNEGHVAGVRELLEAAGARMAYPPPLYVVHGDVTPPPPSDAELARRVWVGARPDVVHVTYSSLDAVPEQAWDQFRRWAADHTVRFYDDAACVAYLSAHFAELMPRYAALKKPAHRADLFRYAVLYREGGVYLDVKTLLVRPLADAFPDRRAVYSVLSKWGDRVHQGILAAPARHPLFRELLDLLARTPQKEVDADFHVFCKQMYAKRHAHNVTLFREREVAAGEHGCARGDRYGKCTTVLDDARAVQFLTRMRGFFLDKSEAALADADRRAADGADELGALYAAVDAHQGNWEAWLRWALAHLARDVGLANGGGADAGGHRKHWTQALEQCVAQLLPADPRAAELVRRVRGAGHHAVAQQVETVLRDQGKLS